MAVDTDFLNILGPFPILQVTAAAVVLGVCAIVWLRGTRQDPPSSDEALQNMLRMDGPIAVTIGYLRRIAVAAEKVQEHCQQMAEEERNQTRALDEINRRQK
jgi:hypothetical protein